jgi:hypothetical protein
MAKARASRFLENLISALVGCLLCPIGSGVPIRRLLRNWPTSRLGLRRTMLRSSASIKGCPTVDGERRIIARQLKNFFDGPTNIPRIAQHMRLPAFRYAALDPYTWPPARN